MEIIKFINDKCILVNQIKIDNDHSLIISRLKNCKFENFNFDLIDNLWYYQNYKLKTRLFDILYPNNKNNTFIFLNNNSNDYRKQNIKINTPHKYLDIFPEPKNYTILEYGSPYKIIAGKYSGQYRNMYWKVKNNNLIYYLMHIKDDIYTKISLDDIDKVLYFKNTRSSYYIHSNGYIATTVNSDRCFYYLHQLIMDVHDENLSDFTKTVDHINRDKLDNRRGNLRSVDMSIQNSNRDKSERRKDAIELPNGINQSDLPKYIVYRKEILNKNNGRYREYFYICNHPKLKRWETPKSNKLTIQEKLNIVIKKIEELNNDLKTGTPSNSNNNSDNDSDNNLTNDSENNAEIKYEYNKESKKMKDDSEVLSNNLINNSKSSSSADKIIDTNLILPKNIKLNLPPNFSFYKEKGKYYFQYAKVINKIRYSKKIIVASNDIQLEFNNFVKLLNNENSNLKIDNYIIPNIPNDVHIVKHKDEHIIIKPTMPVNFSITTINNVDYIQFSKKGNGLTKQYKTKINSYDIHSELDKFIDYLNSNYSLELNKDNYKIINDNNWKTSNKIIDHDNPTELQLKNRKKALKSLNKKKEELGKDEFNKQRNEYMKNYRNLIFTQSRD
jgi:hypothetical protein